MFRKSSKYIYKQKNFSAPYTPKKAALFYGIIFTLLLSGSAYATLLPTKEGDSGIDHGIRWEAYALQKKDTPKKLFGKYYQKVIRLNRMAKHFWVEGTVIKKPVKEDLKKLKKWTPMPKTYPDCLPKGRSYTYTNKKCIVVSLSDQFLGIYIKGKLKKSYPVSTGIPGYETPTGKFKVLSSSPDKKIKIKKIFSYTYDVWMRWPLNIGHEIFIHAGDLPGYPASHGCIRLMNKPAYKLYKMTPISTPVFIIN